MTQNQLMTNLARQPHYLVNKQVHQQHSLGMNSASGQPDHRGARCHDQQQHLNDNDLGRPSIHRDFRDWVVAALEEVLHLRNRWLLEQLVEEARTSDGMPSVLGNSLAAVGTPELENEMTLPLLPVASIALHQN